jgi:uncharacterized glyoxalase superfamily protein PhnB
VAVSVKFTERDALSRTDNFRCLRTTEWLAGLHETDYGSRDFAVRDPGGNRWSFGTYRGEPRKGTAG